MDGEVSTAALIMQLTEAIESWRGLNARRQELVEEIDAVREQLAASGIHITLDDFDQNVRQVSAVVPPISGGLAQPEEVVTVGPDTYEMVEDPNAGAQGNWAMDALNRAVKVGLGANVSNFSPTRDGAVQTRGYGG